VFNPQASTVPSDLSAIEWLAPSATAMTPDSVLTLTGSGRFVCVLSPTAH
jgi:hypothetical protein